MRPPLHRPQGRDLAGGRRLTRRQFLQSAGALAALLLAVPLRLSSPPYAAAARRSGIRSWEWSQSTVADFGQGTAEGLAVGATGAAARSPEPLLDPWGFVRSLFAPRETSARVVLAAGASRGVYTSPAKKAEFPFNALGSRWEVELPEGTRMRLELRTSSDGVFWSPWMEVRPGHGGRQQGEAEFGELVVASGSYVQYRVHLEAEVGAATPVIRGVTLFGIDSSAGSPQLRVFSQARVQASEGPPQKPSIISRADWGCPEPNSSTGWKPEYREIEKVIIHHTATKNNDSDPQATVRAIWYYHAVTRKWGDIGYNYLVDQQGNVYEGRYGGEKVVGGHAYCFNYGSVGVAMLGSYTSVDIPEAQQTAAADLVAWAADRYTLDPKARAYFVDRAMYNIAGHRDGNGSCGVDTTCPGNKGYEWLSTLRDLVWERFVDYNAGWGEHDSLQTVDVGSAVNFNVTVRNRGRKTWYVGGATPVRLGYKWYRDDGSQVVQSLEEDRRTSIPYSLTYAAEARVQAQIVAPRALGSYVLELDMVQEGVTWFSEKGSSPLRQTVEVVDPTQLYRAEYAAQSPLKGLLLPGERATFWVELRNAGQATWYRDGPYPVKLGTSHERDRSSPFYTPGSWEAPHRAALLEQAEVAPGGIGRFLFTITAPKALGSYREYFQLVAENRAWFNDLGIYFETIVDVPFRTFVPSIGG